MIGRGVIALIGAECTGKTTLARVLAQEMEATLVPEALRDFVDEYGRAPRVDEQAAVLAAQMAAEAAAAADGQWVVSDAGALMTAVYSIVYYSDPSLAACALQHHRDACVATVWCDTQIPWVPDAGHRDGPGRRQAADEVIASLLQGVQLPVIRVRGTVAERLMSIREALANGRGPGG